MQFSFSVFLRLGRCPALLLLRFRCEPFHTNSGRANTRGEWPINPCT